MHNTLWPTFVYLVTDHVQNETEVVDYIHYPGDTQDVIEDVAYILNRLKLLYTTNNPTKQVAIVDEQVIDLATKEPVFTVRPQRIRHEQFSEEAHVQQATRMLINVLTSLEGGPIKWSDETIQSIKSDLELWRWSVVATEKASEASNLIVSSAISRLRTLIGDDTQTVPSGTTLH